MTAGPRGNGAKSGALRRLAGLDRYPWRSVLPLLEDLGDDGDVDHPRNGACTGLTWRNMAPCASYRTAAARQRWCALPAGIHDKVTFVSQSDDTRKAIAVMTAWNAHPDVDLVTIMEDHVGDDVATDLLGLARGLAILCSIVLRTLDAVAEMPVEETLQEVARRLSAE